MSGNSGGDGGGVVVGRERWATEWVGVPLVISLSIILPSGLVRIMTLK